LVNNIELAYKGRMLHVDQMFCLNECLSEKLVVQCTFFLDIIKEKQCLLNPISTEDKLTAFKAYVKVLP